MIRVALKGLAGRKLRSALTALAIVLGVAMISGTFILTDTINKGFTTIFTESYKNTSAVITAHSAISSSNSGAALTGGFPASVLDEVQRLPDVSAAAGSITDTAMRKLLTLQGPMRPRQLIAPARYVDAANPLASADRHHRIRVSFARPSATAGHLAGAFGGAISPSQWIELIARLGEIPSPVVRSGPSPASIPDHPAPAGANAGAAGGNG